MTTKLCSISVALGLFFNLLMISSVVCPAPMAVKLDQAAVEEYLRRPTMVEAIIKSNERLAPAELVKVENFTVRFVKTMSFQVLTVFFILAISKPENRFCATFEPENRARH